MPAVAGMAERSQIAPRQSQVRPLGYGLDVVGIRCTLAASRCAAHWVGLKKEAAASLPIGGISALRAGAALLIMSLALGRLALAGLPTRHDAAATA